MKPIRLASAIALATALVLTSRGHLGHLLLLHGQAPATSAVDTGFQKFWDARSPGDASKLIDDVIKSGVSYDEALRRLKQGRSYAAQKSGVVMTTNRTQDKVEHYYAVNVPDGYVAIAPASVPAGEEVLLAALNSEGRLLTFPVTDLPEMPLGKGNKIFGVSTKKSLVEPETLVAIAAVAPGQTLRLLAGERHMGLTYRELDEYRGERGQRGAVLPRGWRKVDALEIA